jgi:Helix-turn-helix domain
MDKLMSLKEAKRAQILEQMTAGKISQTEAAKRIGITVRQVHRLDKRYRAFGLAGLISKKRGRAPNNRIEPAILAQAMALVGAHYADFGPTLATEKLREQHALAFSVETVRQQMIAEGLWQPRKGGKISVHPMRCRRARFGELIQIDGSPHDWFEGRAASCTLLVFIDDASSRLTQLRFMPTETTLGYMRVLHDHIVAHDVPVALYSDKHSIFRINARDADPEAETQFSRAARELGIELIHAHSPQAKGRVERANQTLQDRLVKEMRLAGISDMDSANVWLAQGHYISDHNRRFAVMPKEVTDAHQCYAGTPEALRHTCSVQTTKTLSKNLACQHQNQLLQVATTGTGLGLRGAKIMVHEHFDGTKTLFWKQRKLNYTVLDRPLRQASVADGKTVNARVDQAIIRRNRGHKPAPDHPWRKMPIGNAGDGHRVTL